MKKKVEVEIAIPSVPNFLRNIVAGRNHAILMPIQDFSDEELGEIGKEWTKELIKIAKKRRKLPRN